MLTEQLIKSKLHYDPLTGLFTNIKNGKVYKAGKGPYVAIYLDGKMHKAHRLAFVYMTGSLPIDECDHINGIKDDNTWTNLRNATRAENRQNTTKLSTNKTGYKGVYWYKKANKYKSEIMSNGVTYRFGYFDTALEAANAYIDGCTKLHGVFAKW